MSNETIIKILNRNSYSLALVLRGQGDNQKHYIKIIKNGETPKYKEILLAASVIMEKMPDAVFAENCFDYLETDMSKSTYSKFVEEFE